jgi:hypothetical protein
MTVLRPRNWISLIEHSLPEVSMGKPLVLLLLVFWAFLAYRALQRGDVMAAALYAIVGIALTAYRLRSRSSST